MSSNNVREILTTPQADLVAILSQCTKADLVAALAVAASGYAGIADQQENGVMFSNASDVDLARATDRAVDLFSVALIQLNAKKLADSWARRNLVGQAVAA